MKKAFSKRIKLTKRGKLKRRAMGLGHSKTNKNANQLLRKKRQRGLGFSARVVNKYLR